MDVSELEAAYRAVFDLAGRSAGRRPDPPPDGDDQAWGPDEVLAHLVVNDRMLSQAVRSVLEGAAEPYDNADAVATAELRALAGRLGGTAGLVGELEASSRELVDLAAQLDEAQAATPLPARIVDGGKVWLDGPIPVRGLLATQARAHLPMHARQLDELLGPAP